MSSLKGLPPPGAKGKSSFLDSDPDSDEDIGKMKEGIDKRLANMPKPAAKKEVMTEDEVSSSTIITTTMEISVKFRV